MFPNSDSFSNEFYIFAMKLLGVKAPMNQLSDGIDDSELKSLQRDIIDLSSPDFGESININL